MDSNEWFKFKIAIDGNQKTIGTKVDKVLKTRLGGGKDYVLKKKNNLVKFQPTDDGIWVFISQSFGKPIVEPTAFAVGEVPGVTIVGWGKLLNQEMAAKDKPTDAPIEEEAPKAKGKLFELTLTPTNRGNNVDFTKTWTTIVEIVRADKQVNELVEIDDAKMTLRFRASASARKDLLRDIRGRKHLDWGAQILIQPCKE